MAGPAGILAGFAAGQQPPRRARQCEQGRRQGRLRTVDRRRRTAGFPRPVEHPDRIIAAANEFHRGVGRDGSDARADPVMVAATGSAVLPPERAGSPGSLIVSFAGSYLRELGGWISVADLIRCLKAVDLGESSVRQALMRLKSRGFLAAERRSS